MGQIKFCIRIFFLLNLVIFVQQKTEYDKNRRYK